MLSSINKKSNMGMAPRAIHDLFEQVRAKSEDRYVTVFCSFLQIYNEGVYDLLNEGMFSKKKSSGRHGLRLRWTKHDQFVVENLFVFECQN